MPHFSNAGEEQWVCQKGAHICTGPSIWVDPGTPMAVQVEAVGNVCHECYKKTIKKSSQAQLPIQKYVSQLRVGDVFRFQLGMTGPFCHMVVTERWQSTVEAVRPYAYFGKDGLAHELQIKKETIPMLNNEMRVFWVDNVKYN